MNFVFSFYFLIFYLQFLPSNQDTAESHNNILKALLNYRQSKITDLIKPRGILQARKTLLSSNCRLHISEQARAAPEGFP